MSLHKVDWQELQLKLLRFTHQEFFRKGITIVRGTGEGPSDLAMEALKRFIDPQDQTVRWDPKRGKPTTKRVLAYLKQVVRFDVIDRLRSQKSKRHVDESTLQSHPGNVTSSSLSRSRQRGSGENPLQEQHVFRKSVLDALVSSLAEEPDDDLFEYLAFQFPDGTEYADHKPRNVAEEFGWEISRVTSAKKRLERRINRLFPLVSTADMPR